MRTVTIRVFDSDFEIWTRAANLCGISVSEWIRRQCNEPNGRRRVEISQPEEKGNGSSDHKDVLRPEGTPVPRRRVSVGRRGPTGRGNPAGSNRGTKPLDSASISIFTPEPLGSGDPEPRVDAFVIHTASSNRLTCLCPTCSEYRKSNAIPLGGLPKKQSRWKK